jgi:hypothetical protein
LIHPKGKTNNKLDIKRKQFSRIICFLFITSFFAPAPSFGTTQYVKLTIKDPYSTYFGYIVRKNHQNITLPKGQSIHSLNPEDEKFYLFNPVGYGYKASMTFTISNDWSSYLGGAYSALAGSEKQITIDPILIHHTVNTDLSTLHNTTYTCTFHIDRDKPDNYVQNMSLADCAFKERVPKAAE